MLGKRTTNKQLRDFTRQHAFLSGQYSALCDRMIAAGRGDERPSDYEKKTDDLSVALRQTSVDMYGILLAGQKLYGPDWRPGLEIR